MADSSASILKDISLLLVEDEKMIRTAMADFLAPRCGKLILAGDGAEALELFPREKPDLILTDIIMPRMDGITLTEELRVVSPETPVVLHSAYSEVPILIRGIELGVTGFVPKPSDGDKLIEVLEKAALPIVQKRQLQGLRKELLLSVEQLLGKGPRLKAIASQVERVARTNFAVLISGETGTGKSRLASIIHNLSPRADKPFITVQLGAIPESLVAAELFGHERGAFTGADRRREGLVTAAQGGTLFLDDLDTAPPNVQAMLLRLVEERCFSPLGSNRRIEADIRILSASNRNLAVEAANGRFRQDLYYRLTGMAIDLPPLRAIREDIPELVQTFLFEACNEIDRELPLLGDKAVVRLQNHSWPGNIRELRNVIKRAALLSDDVIDPAIVETAIGPDHASPPSADLPAQIPTQLPTDIPFTMDSVEKWALQRALTHVSGKKMPAARLLGMNYYTFRRRLARYGLDDAEDL